MNRLNIHHVLLLSAMSFVPGAVVAASCDSSRGYVGMEGAGSRTGDSLWGADEPAFRNNNQFTVYASGTGNCALSDELSLKAQASAVYTAQSSVPGILEDRKNQGQALFNQASATWQPSNNVFVDIGKLIKSSGFLFSSSPLDLLHNVNGNRRSVHVNALGDRWRNFYTEGALGGAWSLFNTHGTVEATVMPRLVSNPHRQNSASDWSMLERTNSTDRYLLSYASSGLESFNPTVSLLLGQQKTLALGTSGNISDSWVFNLEGSVSQGKTWRHLDTEAAYTTRNYQTVTTPFSTPDRGVSADIGAGLRYTNQDQTEYGIEYYGQSQGYSRGEWNALFETVSFVNGGYRNPLLPGTGLPAVQAGYQQYSSMMAAEIDNVGRSGHLQGKHYLTLYTSSNKNELKRIDWRVSGVMNLVDQSTMLNLHLNTHVTDQVEVYTGAGLSFGSQRSEFGTFGEKGNYYAGIRVLW